MDEATNKTIRQHEAQTPDWRYSELSKHLYIWFDRFNEQFFENLLQTPAISFERERANSLGHYLLTRNAFGLKWNININSLYTDLPFADTLGTLLHEMIHQWQQEFGEKKFLLQKIIIIMPNLEQKQKVLASPQIIMEET